MCSIACVCAHQGTCMHACLRLCLRVHACVCLWQLCTCVCVVYTCMCMCASACTHGCAVQCVLVAAHMHVWYMCVHACASLLPVFETQPRRQVPCVWCARIDMMPMPCCACFCTPIAGLRVGTDEEMLAFGDGVGSVIRVDQAVLSASVVIPAGVCRGMPPGIGFDTYEHMGVDMCVGVCVDMRSISLHCTLQPQMS